MIIGIPKEIKNNENRVALTPAGAFALTKAGHCVLVEKGAGSGSGFEDEEFADRLIKSFMKAKRIWTIIGKITAKSAVS